MSSAKNLVKQLKGDWHGHYGNAACPICQRERRVDQRALSVSNSDQGRMLLHCFKCGSGYSRILAAAMCTGTTLAFRDQADFRTSKPKISRNSEIASRIWNSSVSIHNSPAERYLQQRGISPYQLNSLSYELNCAHLDRTIQPALIAKIEGSPSFAIHRTFLDAKTFGKSSSVPAKAMLGPTRGGSVRLKKGTAGLIVAEGIETTLSAWQLESQDMSAWAALSSSGLRNLTLPMTPSKLIIASDGDAAGHRAALALATRASAAGWLVFLKPAPLGWDWNDVLLEEMGE